jgi:ubiquinone/menaquinone biosynthesis C-methylase UbiE
MVDEFKDFYEEEGKVIRSDETNPDVIVRFKHMILPLIEKTNSTKILDVGSGDGYLVYALGTVGNLADGIDISPYRVNYAIQKYGEHFKVGSAYNIDAVDGQYQMVIASEVIEHLDDPDKAIQEFKRVTDRYILLTVPYKEKKVLDVCPHCLKMFCRSGHINYFDNEKIKELTQKHNLKIIGTKRVAYYPFINFPFPISYMVNFVLKLLDKTTYIAILCEVMK